MNAMVTQYATSQCIHICGSAIWRLYAFTNAAFRSKNGKIYSVCGFCKMVLLGKRESPLRFSPNFSCKGLDNAAKNVYNICYIT